MPPKATAVGRHPALLALERRQAATTTGTTEPENFHKPNLPPLQGTPSARRQYGYGADAEPSPSRPRGRGDVVDLRFAVQDAIEKRDQQLEEARKVQQQRQADVEQFVQQVGRSFSQPNEEEQEPSVHQPPTQQGDDSDTDDARSFAMESDIYADAAIISPPRPAPPAAASQPRLGNLSQRPILEPPSYTTGHATPARPQKSSTADNDSRRLPNEQARLSRRRNPFSLLQQDTAKSSAATEAETEATVPREERATAAAAQKTRFSSNTAASKRAPFVQKSGNSQHDRRQPAAAVEIPTTWRPGLFTQARNMIAAVSPVSNRHYGSDHSEMDDALQRSIHSDAGDDIEDEPRPEDWRQGGNSWQSVPLSRRDAPRLQQVESPLETAREPEADHDGINWWQLLNPLTYFKALPWIFRAIRSFVFAVLDMLFPNDVRDRLKWLFDMLLYSFAVIIGLIVVVSLANRALFGSVDGDYDFDLSADELVGDRYFDVPEMTVTWPNMTNMANKVIKFVPQLRWPTWNRHGSLPDLSNLDSDSLVRLGDYLRQYQHEFDRIEQAGKLHDSSLKTLETVVPKLVHMQLKNGKPVVAQEFWHALRDLIHSDGHILTFEKKDGVYKVASEAHWKAIAAGIAKDPGLTKQINATVKSMEQRVKNGAAGFWDSWVRNNDAKIAEMLGSALDQIQSAGSQREFDKRLQHIFKEHIDQSSNKNSSVVSRDDFLRLLSDELVSHRAEIRAELAQLQPQLDQLVHQAAELVEKARPESMTKAEIVTFVQDTVNKAVAGINLDVMARGQIHSHWDSVLRYQVNYFGTGAGATIDGQHISPTFEAPRDSSYVWQKGYRAVQPSIPRVALEPWTDEGECWCASRSRNHRGNPHGAILAVQLGHRVIPQHIVMEHIVAAATIDPGARPKEIEVYAEVDSDLREVVRDFSAVHFPDVYPIEDGKDVQGWNVSPAELPERFVKIGQFVYEESQSQDGVQVHRLSDELVNLGVATEHVIVRAVSNYGAKTHTCLYRVRLFGKRVGDGTIPKYDEGWTGWMLRKLTFGML